MRRLASLPLLVLLAGLAPVTALAETPVVRFVDFDTTVNPWSAKRILRAIEDAEAAGDDLVLIQLDTPGGLVDSMDDIVQGLLAAEVPVVVWVGPSGAKAASAGFFILMAADVAAMAPGTRTGAASTVIMGGENKEGDVLLKKGNEDVAALCRSITERRGRAVELCDKAVMEAKAWEEQVALEEGLIEIVASSRELLLEQLDSREIRRFDGSTVVLRVAGARFVTSQYSWRQRFSELLTHPIVSYLLFMGAMAGLYFEFTNPGAVFPGVVGAICLLLFVLSAQALPVSVVGVLLILMSAVLFILEIKVTSYGLLTVGGVLCLVIGSVILIDGPIPEMRVPYRAVIPGSLTVAAICVGALTLALKAQRVKVATGVEGLAGEVGRVTRDLAPHGQILVHGELWNAESSGGEPLPRGARVRVVKVAQMELTVEPISDSASQRS